MADTDQHPHSPLTAKVVRLLAEQPQSPAGEIVGGHLREILEMYELEAARTRELYLALLRDLLKAYSQTLPAGGPEQIGVRILLLRLDGRPDRAELESVGRHILALTGGPSGSIEPAQTAHVPPPAAAPASIAAAPEPVTAEPSASEPAQDVEEAAERLPDTSAQAAEPVLPAEGTDLEPDDAEAPADIGNRRYLDEKRARVLKVQETLSQQVKEVIKQNERFGALLSAEHQNLLQTENLDSLQKLKESLIGEVSTLREGHEMLARKLETANKYLQIIETEGQYLNDELTRVHILSLTDELTELPNRRAFMRRLEDEVARVQRYGYPLSLALLDMDSFKSVNDKYGHAAGDEVLRNFSANILSIFRHHDMVARYGGEEFVVLLPNTDKAGALRALEKVKKRTTDSSYQFEGKTMPMPTFSAGISLYRPGETPGNLIERADKALYQAKRMGRNRIELAQHDGADVTPR